MKNIVASFWQTVRARRQTLPVQLLLLTVLFVIIAEVLLFIPSVSKFRYDWLAERIDRAYLASLAFEVAPENMVDDATVRQLFSTAEIQGVRLEVDGRSQLVLGPDTTPEEGLRYVQIDLRHHNQLIYLRDAINTLLSTQNSYLLVMGEPEAAPGMTVELFMEKAPLQQALWRYSAGVLGLSLIIAFFVAGGIYYSILRIFMRPVISLTDNMAHFHEQPEDVERLMVPTGRADEIGQAEEVLARMQNEIRDALKQKNRLATLGEGVAKINHDLRNVLASAVLMSDRLAKSDDPRVQKLSPRLIQALNKAVALCRATLDYGQADISEITPLHIFDLVEETSEGLKHFTEGEDPVRFVNNVSPDIVIHGDHTQLYRAFFNLARNAAEVMKEVQTSNPAILFEARLLDDIVLVEISDNGPGVPEDAQTDLFVPFKGSKRRGGTGLGLAIVYETVHVHGGEVELMETGPGGTKFQLRLPVTPPLQR